MHCTSARRRLGLSLFARRRHVARVVVAGALDIGTAPSLVRMITDLGEQPGTDVALDLQNVTFLDPAGLAAVHRAGQAIPGRLSVRPPTGGAARHLVDVLGAGELLPAAA